MMLRFKKIMAVLLAAALALTMLTACGGGGGGKGVNEKVELTNKLNDILKEDKYSITLKYNTELDRKADTYYVADIDKVNADWKTDKLNRKMFKVTVKESEKTDTAKKIAKEIEVSLTDTVDYEWSIGYHVEIHANSEDKIVSRDIYVVLAWTVKTEK